MYTVKIVILCVTLLAYYSSARSEFVELISSPSDITAHLYLVGDFSESELMEGKILDRVYGAEMFGLTTTTMLIYNTLLISSSVTNIAYMHDKKGFINVETKRKYYIFI